MCGIEKIRLEMSEVKKILITGGMRSGKSSYALQLANQIKGEKAFIATAQSTDDDMKARIERHKEERSNVYQTIEEPIYLSKALDALRRSANVIVIDCLTLWMSNLLFASQKDVDVECEISLFVTRLQQTQADIIIVTNEVGLGIIADNKLSRDFTEKLGFLNQKIAKVCDDVVLMVCGCPQMAKSSVKIKCEVG